MDSSLDPSNNFDDSINSFFLTFKDNELEQEYNANTTSLFSRIKCLKIGLITLISILMIRRLELIIIAIAYIETYPGNINMIIIVFSYSMGVLILEYLIYHNSKIKQFKRVLGVLCCKFTCYYFSYTIYDNTPLMNQAMIVYCTLLFITGFFYMYSWIYSGIS